MDWAREEGIRPEATLESRERVRKSLATAAGCAPGRWPMRSTRGLTGTSALCKMRVCPEIPVLGRAGWLTGRVRASVQSR